MLEGDGDEVEEALKEGQHDAVERLAFEQAGRLQAHRDTLQQALRLIRRVRERAGDLRPVRASVAARRARRSLRGRRGAIIVEREISPRRFNHDAALAVLRDVYGTEPASPPLPTEAIDELLLVHSWLRCRHAVNVLSLWRPRPDAEDYDELIADQLHLTASELLAKIRLVATAAPIPIWVTTPTSSPRARTRSPLPRRRSGQVRLSNRRRASDPSRQNVLAHLAPHVAVDRSRAPRPPFFRPTFHEHMFVLLVVPCTREGSEL